MALSRLFPRLAGLVAVALVALSVGCAPPTTAAPAVEATASPSAAGCIEKGGDLSVVKGEAGEVEMCIFPNGGACEVGALGRGECRPDDEQSQLANPASQYCEAGGGKVEIVGDGAGEWGKCSFKDGSWCDEWSYFRGACKPGDQKP